MRSLPRILPIALAGLLLAGCAQAPAHYDSDPAVDFSGWDSWRWQQPTPPADADAPAFDSELFARRVHRAVTEVLGARGIAERADDARFTVSYDLDLHGDRPEQPRSRLSIGVGLGSFGGRSSSAISVGGSTAVGDAEREVTLAIDVRDARSGALVWRGWDSLQASGGAAGDEAVRRAVRSILAGFPPKH